MEPDPGSYPATTTYNILFVCTGNTCRSPMAEAVARAELERRGWRHVQVASAGTSTEPGLGAAQHAVSVAERRGIDLGHHSLRRPEAITVRLRAQPHHLLARLERRLDAAEGAAIGAPEGRVNRGVGLALEMSEAVPVVRAILRHR